VTRTPLSRSKGQGHQAALLSAALTRNAAAAVSGVGTYSAWESYLTSARRAQGARAPTGEKRSGGILCRHAHSLFHCRVLKAFMTLGVTLTSVNALRFPSFPVSLTPVRTSFYSPAFSGDPY